MQLNQIAAIARRRVGTENCAAVLWFQLGITIWYHSGFFAALLIKSPFRSLKVCAAGSQRRHGDGQDTGAPIESSRFCNVGAELEHAQNISSDSYWVSPYAWQERLEADRIIWVSLSDFQFPISNFAGFQSDQAVFMHSKTPIIIAAKVILWLSRVRNKPQNLDACTVQKKTTTKKTVLAFCNYLELDKKLHLLWLFYVLAPGWTDLIGGSFSLNLPISVMDTTGWCIFQTRLNQRVDIPLAGLENFTSPWLLFSKSAQAWDAIIYRTAADASWECTAFGVQCSQWLSCSQ